MKTILIATLVFSSISAFAGSSDTLKLKGKVEVVNEIDVQALSAAENLQILTGESRSKVADVSETSNDRKGYKIFMRSQHAGQLVHTEDPQFFSTYKLSYDGKAPLAPTTTDQEVKSVSALTGLTTAISEVKIDLTAAPNAVAGEYEDLVTFSIVAN